MDNFYDGPVKGRRARPRALSTSEPANCEPRVNAPQDLAVRLLMAKYALSANVASLLAGLAGIGGRAA
jgi:hypothetical protein